MLKIQNNTPLLNDKEIEQLFFNFALHDKNSFFVIDKERKGYDTERKHEAYMDAARYLKDKYNSGHTIVVKNMEHFNASIREAAEELGQGTDVHLYLAPEGGDSFDWHQDDRTVYVKMIKGCKLFSLKTQANETTMMDLVKLHEGNILYIPKGRWHKATPMGPSILLSFGLPNQEDA